MKKITALLLTVSLWSVFTLPIHSQPTTNQGQETPNARPQSYPEGKITNRYRKEQSGAQSLWVDEALKRSFAYIQRNANNLGIADADAELTLLNALQDDFGMTHVRLGGDTTRFNTIEELLAPTRAAQMVEAFVVTGEYRRRFGAE